MAYSPTSPLTGLVVNGFTSPTYTLTSDRVPNGIVGSQWLVSALGGTQTGVTTHSVSSPFTVTVTRPNQLKALAAPNPLTGVVRNVPRNVYKVLVRKGATPAADQSEEVAIMELNIRVPAGTDSYDSAELAAMLSLFGGFITDQKDEILDAMKTGSV